MSCRAIRHRRAMREVFENLTLCRQAKLEGLHFRNVYSASTRASRSFGLRQTSQVPMPSTMP